MRDGGTRGGHGAVRLGCLGAHAAPHGRYFEGQGRDLSVLWTELPLVLLAGMLTPPAVWLLTMRLLHGHGRLRHRALVAAVCTAGVLALSVWGLHAWANPPDPDHIPLSGSPVSDLDA